MRETETATCRTVFRGRVVFVKSIGVLAILERFFPMAYCTLIRKRLERNSRTEAAKKRSVREFSIKNEYCYYPSGAPEILTIAQQASPRPFRQNRARTYDRARPDGSLRRLQGAHPRRRG